MNSWMSMSPQFCPREGRENVGGSVNILVVVFAQLLFFLRTPASYGLLDVAAGVFATDHESNLA